MAATGKPLVGPPTTACPAKVTGLHTFSFLTRHPCLSLQIPRSPMCRRSDHCTGRPDCAEWPDEAAACISRWPAQAACSPGSSQIATPFSVGESCRNLQRCFHRCQFAPRGTRVGCIDRREFGESPTRTVLSIWDRFWAKCAPSCRICRHPPAGRPAPFERALCPPSDSSVLDAIGRPHRRNFATGGGCGHCKHSSATSERARRCSARAC